VPKGSDTSWFVREVPDGLSLALPGVYEWYIEGVGFYVGKSKGLHRRLREYPIGAASPTSSGAFITNFTRPSRPDDASR
jgi:hypothetical protein